MSRFKELIGRFFKILNFKSTDKPTDKSANTEKIQSNISSDTKEVNSSPTVICKSNEKANLKNHKKKTRKPQHPAVTVTINIFQCLFYIIFVVGLSVYLGVNIINIANDVFALKKEEASYTITLNENTTITEISEKLEENKIIKYGKVFELYCTLLRKDNGEFLTGDVEINSSMDYDAIRAKLKYKNTETKVVRLVIPEGYTVEQIVDLLVSNGIGEKNKYIEVINNYDFEFDFIPAIEALKDGRTYRLEGYLFPDTYDFATNEKEETVIYKFLSNFQRKFEKEYYNRAQELGMTVDEVLTLASMIEREVRIATDYELVSSVFHNRLKSNTLKKLESDATINYFLEEHTKDLTAEHLSIDNPYNTYMYEGLPPGPICNPGVEAIAYAFYPVTTKYYFFVSQDDGTTLYAETKAQHEVNKEIARRANESYNKQEK